MANSSASNSHQVQDQTSEEADLSLSQGNRYGGTSCVVVGCTNTSYRNRDVHFYGFPKKNKDKADAWVRSIKRVKPDGTPWIPSKNSKVCSSHFIDNKKSDDPTSPSYLPTIFPTNHRPEVTEQELQRFERAKRRRTGTCSTDPDTINEDNSVSQMSCEDEVTSVPDYLISKRDFCVQTDPVSRYELQEFSWDFACISTTEKGTQVFIPAKYWPSEKGTQTVTDLVRKKQKGTMTDKTDFTNFSQMRRDKFKSLLGVEPEFFKMLFSRLEQRISNSYKMDKEQKLELFFLQLKLNVSYVNLGAFFGISDNLAGSIFKEMLDLVFEEVKPLVFWPSREQVQGKMPASVKAKFPEARVIIDCSEIETEVPAYVRSRNLTYSAYKSRFTLKFLVAIAPSGEIIFISKAFGGRATDAQVTVQSGFLNYIEEGDVIMSDKGFPSIETNVNQAGGILVMPPFKRGGKKFTKQQGREGGE